MSDKPTSAQYRKYYLKHHASKEQMKERASRNRARGEAMKNGTVQKGDGKEIDHLDRNPRNNAAKNIRVVSRKYNRSRPKKKG